MTTRRTVLRTAAAAAAATGLGGCAGDRRSTRAIEVAVVWSGPELTRFQEVVDDFPGRVEVVSARDDIDALLSARHQAGALPDVAVLSRPGLVATYADRGWLQPLDAALAARFPAAWADLLRVRGNLYGAWVKAAHKSLFWYLPSALPAPPRTWDELVSLVQAGGAGGGPAPLAIGAADGWVLTDWLENLLFGLDDADLYRRLAAGEPAWHAEPAREAVRLLARLWSVPGAFPGGGRRALLTQFEESVIQVVASRQAVTVFEGDFVSAVVRRFRPAGAGETPRTFRFPPPGVRPPLVVGGDAAVVLRNSSTAHAFVDWLAGPDAFRPWIDRGGFLSPNLTIPSTHYPAGQPRDLVEEIRDPAAQWRFDLSDQLSGRLGGQGFWTILQDFFSAVTAERPARSASLDKAGNDLIATLDRAASRQVADASKARR